MALWKEQATAKKDPTPPATPPPAQPRKEPPMPESKTVRDDFAHHSPGTAAKESLVASDLTIEGTIQGTGNVRIAGKFNGDVHVQGDVTIEKGAKVTGGIQARAVTIAGELEGNIESAERVELLASGVLAGDVKAAQLTVAAGSKMRGKVEFGWDDRSGANKQRPVAMEKSPAA